MSTASPEPTTGSAYSIRFSAADDTLIEGLMRDMGVPKASVLKAGLRALRREVDRGKADRAKKRSNRG